MVHLSLLLVVVTKTFLLWASAQASNITCKIGVYSGLTGVFLTCHFQEDISKTRRNFNVYHFPLNEIGEAELQKGKEIVLCNWIRDTTKLECEKKAGFSFDYNVSDHLTLIFPQISREVSGSYICQLVPDQSDSVIPCNLHVSDHRLPTQTDKTCTNCSSADIPQERYQLPHVTEGLSESGSELSAVIGLSVVVSILVTLIIVGLITYFCKWSKLFLRSKNKPPMLPDPYADQLGCLPPEENDKVHTVDVDNEPLLLHQPTETEDSTRSLDLAAYALHNKPIKVDIPLAEGLDQKGAPEAVSSHGDLTMGDYETISPSAHINDQDHPLPPRSGSSLEVQDSRLSEEHDHYDTIQPAKHPSDQEHNTQSSCKRKVVMAWTTEDLCQFLKKDGGFEDIVVEAFEKGKVTGADFDKFDYEHSLKGSDMDDHHLKRLGSLLDDLKVTRDKQFLDRPGTFCTEVIMV